MQCINRQRFWINAIMLLWLILLLISFLPFGDNHLTLVLDSFQYKQYDLSDWLINYENGFVRRGLCGQLLLWFCTNCNCSPRLVVIWITFISGLILFLLTLRLFYRKGWSPMLIATTVFPFIAILYYAFSIRRDFISILLVFATFACYTKYCKANQNNKLAPLIEVNILFVLNILIHEASIFYSLPICLIHFFFYCKGDFRKWVVDALRLFALPIICFLTACAFKGDETYVNPIWQSWQQLIVQFPDGISDSSQIGEGVKAIGWTTEHAVKVHWRRNITDLDKWGIPAGLYACLFIICMYYALTRLNTAKWAVAKPSKINHIELSNIFIVSFVGMLPMFTILSIDWSRTIVYLTYSVILAYGLFPKVNWGSFLNSLSERMQNAISHNKLLRNPVFYTLVVVLMPLKGYLGPEPFPTYYLTTVKNIFTDLYHLCF